MSWLTDSSFIEHQACPKCGSSDANAVYSDGHTFCFSCHAYTPPTRIEKRVVEKQQFPPMKLEALPNNHRDWLKQYISDDEIDEFFEYDTYTDRHVFTYHKGEDDQFINKRSVNANIYPKVLSYGKKPDLLLGPWKETGTVVLVEDIVSAIKVSRVFGAMPLFGSVVGPFTRGYIKALDEVKTAVVWLDSDKWSTAMDSARLLNYLIPSVAIYSDLDPKEHSEADIRAKVVEAIIALTECSGDCV